MKKIYFNKFINYLLSLIVLFAFLFFINWGIFAAILIPNNILNLGGSTSVFPLITAIEKDWNDKNKKKIEYYSNGSFAGLWNVINERYDIGFMSKNFDVSKDQEIQNILRNQNKELKKFFLAKDGVVFIYHLPENCNLINDSKNLEITSSEIKKIYGTKNSIKWSELNSVTCTKSNTKIIRINRENGSGTRSAFVDKFFASKNEYYEEIVQKSSEPILKTIESPGYLAYISFSYLERIENLNKKNKKINYAKLDKVAPTKETIKDKSYIFYREFIGFFLAKNEKKFKNFFEYLKSEPTKEKINNKKFIYDYRQETN